MKIMEKNNYNKFKYQIKKENALILILVFFIFAG